MNRFRFFFISTYDAVSKYILHELISLHPEIACTYQATSPLLPTAITTTLREYIKNNQPLDKKFSGDVGNFHSYELFCKMNAEDFLPPLKKINISIGPQLRTCFLLYAWQQSNVPLDTLVAEIRNAILNDDKSTLFNLYHIKDVYQRILIIIETLKKRLAENIALQKQYGLETLNTPKGQLFCLALAMVVGFDYADIHTASKNFALEHLLTDKNELKNLFLYLTTPRSGQRVSEDHINAKLQGINNFLSQIPNDNWQPWQYDVFIELIKQNNLNSYSFKGDKTLLNLYQSINYLTDINMPTYKKLVSIHIYSTSVSHLAIFIDALKETVSNFSAIELVVAATDNRIKMLLDNEIAKHYMTIKYFRTFPINNPGEMLAIYDNLLQLTDKEAYFLLPISDQSTFKTKHWDVKLQNYVGLFSDHIFRLRAGNRKLHSYRTPADCIFEQDINFTTQRWLNISGNWSPCYNATSFQQLMAFYLAKAKPNQQQSFQRDIPIFDIEFVEPAHDYPRHSTYKHAWLKPLASYSIQLEAHKRAMRLKSAILLGNSSLGTILEQPKRKAITVQIAGTTLLKLSYKINWFNFTVKKYKQIARNLLSSKFRRQPEVAEQFASQTASNH